MFILRTFAYFSAFWNCNSLCGFAQAFHTFTIINLYKLPFCEFVGGKDEFKWGNFANFA